MQVLCCWRPQPVSCCSQSSTALLCPDQPPDTHHRSRFNCCLPREAGVGFYSTLTNAFFYFWHTCIFSVFKFFAGTFFTFALTLLVGHQEEHPACKNEWWGAGVGLQWGANDLHIIQLMPLPPVISYFIKVQISLTFLVPAYPGCPEKRLLNWFICYRWSVRWHSNTAGTNPVNASMGAGYHTFLCTVIQSLKTIIPVYLGHIKEK